MTDDQEGPAPAGGEADAGAKVLDEQPARIAALRAAVPGGRLPDEDAFDDAWFFAEGVAPGS